MEPQRNENTAVSYGLAVIVLLLLAIIALSFFAFPQSAAKETQPAAAAAYDPFQHIEIEGKAAIVIDLQSGKTLYAKNADVQLPLASLTKVALALVAAEALPFDSVLTIPYMAAGATGGQIGAGQRWPVREIVDFTLVTSSNAGAQILADAADAAIQARYSEAPPGEAALWRMNDLVAKLGMQSTYFLNVTGLDLSTTQAGAYGTAADMATLFTYAASAEPSLFSGTTANGMLLYAESGESTAATNTNAAQSAIPGLIMGKTGLTDLAGGNLAVVFDAGLAQPVVAVVLGSTERGRFDDIMKLVSTTHDALRGAPTE